MQDLLTDMNSYPFLDNKLQTLSDAELGDIVRPVRKNRVIDISSSPWVPATELRAKLENLLMAGELDSGLPILRHGVLAGLIPAPDLEYALDNVVDEENALCLMTTDASSFGGSDDEDDGTADRVDFTRYIDPVCPLLSFSKVHGEKADHAGPHCSRHSLPYRPRLSMFCQAGPAVPGCPSEWIVRGPGT